MFKSIIINKENFPELEVSISSMRTAKDSDGEDFNYYWLTINGYICCTGKKFTELLGVNANDDKAWDTVVANGDKFIIAQAMAETDEVNAKGEPIMEPIYINDDPDQPLLKIQLKPHSKKAAWK